MTVTLSRLVLGPFAQCFSELLDWLLGNLFSCVHLSRPLCPGGCVGRGPGKSVALAALLRT